jgi:hypothetical protein
MTDRLTKALEMARERRERPPQSSPTGEKILPGRFQKVKKDGTPSRRGEWKNRSRLLLNAKPVPFMIDQGLLKALREKAGPRNSGKPGLSELVNLAIAAYLGIDLESGGGY